MAKIIELTQGRFAIIDDDDFERLTRMGKWYSYQPRQNLIYAAKAASKADHERPTTIHMHRIIMNARSGIQVDHINGNGLDNRKVNLRLCSNKENIRNQKPQKNCSSEYKGICWDKRSRKWLARIVVNKRCIHIGYYLSEIFAANEYDKAALKYFGEFARPNFPEIKNDTL